MTRLSVVVPVYDVAPYVGGCLASVAAQTYGDLEVLVVDDGSTDDSSDIAREFCSRDDRFRYVRQPNGGLGNARNNGVASTSGALLAFVDSDDLLAPRAYEVLVGALEASGSDFATGSFRRLDATGSRPAFYAAGAFSDRLSGVHIRDRHELAVDRTAWNKVFRRSFWDRHALRFGEGVQYEDQYATLPAYFLADAVEVLPTCVYYWRLRDDSITRGREEPVAVHDRVTAIRWTRQWLHDNGFPAELPWYDASVLAQDLEYLPDAVLAAPQDDRAALLNLAVGLLGELTPGAVDALPAIDRVAWALVQGGRLEELRQIRDVRGTPRRYAARRRLRHWYGDYPSLGSRHLPRRMFRLDEEIAATSGIVRIHADPDEVVIEGLAYLAFLGAPAGGSCQVDVSAERDGETVRFRVLPVERPELAFLGESRAAHVDGGGYRAVAPTSALVAGESDDSWRLTVTVRVGGESRSTTRHEALPLCPVAAAAARTVTGAEVRAELTSTDELVVTVGTPGPTIDSARVDRDLLRLTGSGLSAGDPQPVLRLSGAVGKKAQLDGERTGADGFLVTLSLADLRSDLDLPTAPQTLRRQALDQWTLAVKSGRSSAAGLRIGSGFGGPWPLGDREWLLSTNRAGRALLVERLPRLTIDDVQVADGRLVLSGTWAAGSERLVLLRAGDETAPVDDVLDDGPDRFRAALPGRPPSVGEWEVVTRVGGRVIPVAFSEALLHSGRLPMPAPATGCALGVRGRAGPVLVWRQVADG